MGRKVQECIHNNLFFLSYYFVYLYTDSIVPRPTWTLVRDIMTLPLLIRMGIVEVIQSRALVRNEIVENYIIY